MVEILLLRNLLIALALGAFIGLEREYARYKKRGHDYAGIRTFPLIALFGALAAYFGDFISPWIFLASIFLMGIIIVLAYVFSNKGKVPQIGATSEVAGFLTFFIGALSYYNEILLALILTIAITIILYARSLLHQFAERIKPKEMADTLLFAVIAFIVLPLLPNIWYGPYGGLINPYVVWLMVVLVSGIGFIGYILLKWLGHRGLLLMGLLGGLVRSTVVTSSFAGRSKKESHLARTLAIGVILANGVMFLRLLVEVLIVNPSVFWSLLLPFLSLVVLTGIFSYALFRKSRENSAKIELSSPLTLKPALQFALLFAVTVALVRVAQVFLQDQGIYVVSFFAGLVNVDAVALSLSQLAKNGLLEETARQGIILAATANFAMKGVVAYWLGGAAFRRLIVGFFAAIVAVGILFFLLL